MELICKKCDKWEGREGEEDQVRFVMWMPDKFNFNISYSRISNYPVFARNLMNNPRKLENIRINLS